MKALCPKKLVKPGPLVADDAVHLWLVVISEVVFRFLQRDVKVGVSRRERFKMQGRRVVEPASGVVLGEAKFSFAPKAASKCRLASAQKLKILRRLGFLS